MLIPYVNESNSKFLNKRESNLLFWAKKKNIPLNNRPAAPSREYTTSTKLNRKIYYKENIHLLKLLNINLFPFMGTIFFNSFSCSFAANKKGFTSMSCENINIDSNNQINSKIESELINRQYKKN